MATRMLTLPFNDDIGIASDSDAWFDLNRSADTMTKNSLRSPWKDETVHQSDGSLRDSDSDYESSNVDRTLRATVSSSHSARDGPNHSRRDRSRFDLATKGSTTCPTNRPQRFKRATDMKRREQKYHWSGRFDGRTKMYTSPVWRRTEQKTLRTLTNDERSLVANPNYNYNLDGRGDEKAATKKIPFRCNKFDGDDESSEGNENACRRSSSNARRFGVDAPQKNRTSARRQANRCGGMGSSRDDSALAVNRSATVDARDSGCLYRNFATPKLCNFLLSFLKTIVFFALLPTLYVVLFVYVKGSQDR